MKVPVENLVGEENKGWTCAKYLLTFERTGIAGVGQSKAALKHLKTVARQVQQNGKPLIEDPLFRNRLADVEMELMALEMTNLRTVAAAPVAYRGRKVPSSRSWAPSCVRRSPICSAARQIRTRSPSCRKALKPITTARVSVGLRQYRVCQVLQHAQAVDLRRFQ